MTDGIVPHDRPSAAATIDLSAVLSALARGQCTSASAFSFVPSENLLSPLARLPFVLDAYSRYFFDHLRLFGSWSFYGGIEEGEIELQLLRPLLCKLARSQYVNVQPLSGLSCMTVAMSALTTPGDTVVCLSESVGGHMSTAGVAARLGLRPVSLPMRSLFDPDLAQLADLLISKGPKLVYLDQSTQLFPLDPGPLRKVIDAVAPGTLLHVDTSHTNGLVLFGALPNPLDRGAHTFGGSTHKTLPGPHKGFIATRDAELAERIDASSGALISQHQPAAVASLAITLIELRDCGGAAYAQQVLTNATTLGRLLDERGVAVQGADRGYSGCHQVWVDHGQRDGGIDLGMRLQQSGLLVNRVGVPGVAGPALRLGLAEFTRLGAAAAEIAELADLFAAAVLESAAPETLRPRVQVMRRLLDRPRYCFEMENLPPDVPAWMSDLVTAIGSALSGASIEEVVG